MNTIALIRPKWIYTKLGEHTHVRCYYNGALNGNLCFTNDEFSELRTALGDLIEIHVDNPEWALWDKKDECWLADDDGPRIFSGTYGKVEAELVAKLLGICACEQCKDRIEARCYNASFTKTRTDVQLP